MKVYLLMETIFSQEWGERTEVINAYEKEEDAHNDRKDWEESMWVGDDQYTTREYWVEELEVLGKARAEKK
jgi:hypothetical protein